MLYVARRWFPRCMAAGWRRVHADDRSLTVAETPANRGPAAHT